MTTSSIQQRFHRSSHNVLICGNGPSLKEIDYLRLPVDYDVFRCNQFYFEDSYFAGKKVKAAFFTPSILFYQYLTCRELKKRDEYHIEYIIASSFNNELFDKKDEFILQQLIDVIDGYHEFLVKTPELDSMLRVAWLYDNQRITSGVYMIISAVMAGYQNIYVAGLDFYRGKGYAFEAAKPNMLTISPIFASPNYGVSDFHSEHFDLAIIDFLIQQYDVNIYSVCPSSFLSEQIGLAEQQTLSSILNTENKSVQALKDIVLPTPLAETKYQRLQEMKMYGRHILSGSHKSIYQNIYYHLVCDLFYLPKVLKNYLSKKIKKLLKKHLS